MEKKKVLFIFQEITPYLPESEMSTIGRYLPQGIQDRGKEIRTFMPRYGTVNERRNQLHEVIRLSGMNLVIDDTDHPLIIKVASIQAARMQVYFIDNDDYFQRKYEVKTDEDRYFDDNDERALFYARGVLETVIKLRWAPDLIHCHGWFSAFVPLLIKKTYADDPLFSHSKVVYTPYDQEFTNKMDENLIRKAQMDDVAPDDVAVLQDPTFLNLNKLAIQYSDGLIMGSSSINADVEEAIKNSGKPFLEYQKPDVYMDTFNEFYDKILSNS
jgi:starch synthase